MNENLISAKMNLSSGDIKKNYGIVVLSGLIMTGMLTAYNGVQNLITDIYEKLGYTDLGIFNIFIVYLFVGLNSFFAEKIVSKIGLNKSLAIFSFGYFIFLFICFLTSLCSSNDIFYCNAPTVYTANFIGAACTGIACPIVMSCAIKYVENLSDETCKSRFMGTYISMIISSNMFGSIFATFLLRYTSDLVFFLVLSILAFGSCAAFFILPQSVKTSNEPEIIPTISESFVKIKELMQNPIVVKLFLTIVFDGLVMGIYAVYLFRVIDYTLEAGISDNMEKFNVSIAFILLGIGSLLSGVICGYIGDKISIIYVLFIAVLTGEVATVSLLLAIYTQRYGLCIVAGFFFGFCDSSLQNGVFTMIQDYKGGIAMLSFLRLGSSVGVLIASILSLTCKGSEFFMPICVMLLILQVVFTLIFSNLSREYKKQNSLQQSLTLELLSWRKGSD